ncbi:hypothetical protein GQ600_729 [Phytophthora cactorum]|nr:hypothetical protein GQ600_729 [Phytophthora cactorum]
MSLWWRDEPTDTSNAARDATSEEENDLEKARVELTLPQLELQIARDKALVARVKARMQLLSKACRGERSIASCR